MSSIRSSTKFKFGKGHALFLAVALVGAISGCSKPAGAGDGLAVKDRIASDHKMEMSKCDQLSGNAKDICVKRADGNRSVALAELEFEQSNKDEDRAKIAMAKSEAAYGIAKQMCDDQAGNAKDVCVKEAEAARVKSNADTKVTKSDVEARDEAVETKRQADYNVAIEKCDSLAGDSKAACVAESKATYSKS